ncbi:MAG: ribonuclease HII [Sulfobacillus sp.]
MDQRRWRSLERHLATMSDGGIETLARVLSAMASDPERMHRVQRELRRRRRDLWHFDRQLCPQRECLAGVDEVGRGALAGPMVAAAVILPWSLRLDGLDDSKRLSSERRLGLIRTLIRRGALWSVAVATQQAIDRRGVGTVNRELMRAALAGLPLRPTVTVVDSVDLSPWPGRLVSLPRADGQSRAVAAASVLAKEVRDLMMRRLGEEAYPGYGFERNVGYGVPEHLQALGALGLTGLHRRSFVGGQLIGAGELA